MEPSSHLASVQREAAALAAAVGRAPNDAPVPTCPEWTPRDLAVHVGAFAGFWAHVLCEGTGRPKPGVPEAPPGGAEAIEAWLSHRTQALVDELEATDPETQVWTWSLDDHRAAFVARRSAHELAVHRVDAQLTCGAAEPIEADLAGDGIDEILMMVDQWQRMGAEDKGAARGTGEALAVHPTDLDRSWRLHLGPEGLEVLEAGGPADLTLEGTVSDLEMWLYDRPPVGAVTAEGDATVREVWRRIFTFT